MRTDSMELKSGDLFCSFEGNLYQVVTIAIHTVSREELVIFQALQDDYRIYAEPKTLFLDEVDHEKNPQAVQKFRFEPVKRETLSRAETKKTVVEKVVVSSNVEIESSLKEKEQQQDGEAVDQYLMDFLDARSYQGKLELLTLIRKHLNERAVSGIEMSLDMTGFHGTLEERIDAIKRNLQTRIKFEGSRLR